MYGIRRADRLDGHSLTSQIKDNLSENHRLKKSRLSKIQYNEDLGF